MKKFILFVLSAVLCFSFCFLMPTNKVKADENINVYSFDSSGMFLFENSVNVNRYVDYGKFLQPNTYTSTSGNMYVWLRNIKFYFDNDGNLYCDLCITLHDSLTERFEFYVYESGTNRLVTFTPFAYSLDDYYFYRIDLNNDRIVDNTLYMVNPWNPPPDNVNVNIGDFLRIEFNNLEELQYKTDLMLFNRVSLGSSSLENDDYMYQFGFTYSSFLSYLGLVGTNQYSITFSCFKHFGSQLYQKNRTYWLMNQDTPTYADAYLQAYNNIISDVSIMNDIRNSVEQTVLDNEYQRGYSAGAKVALSVDTALTDVAEVPLNMVKDFIDFDVPIQVDSEGNVTKVFNLKNIVGVALAFAFLIILLKLFLGGVTK